MQLIKLIFLILSLETFLTCNGDPYCRGCNNNKCLICEESFYKNSKCVVSQQKIRNCMSYEKEGVCKFCKKSYSLERNKCVQIQEQNCLEVNSKGICVMCANRVQAVKGKCNLGGFCQSSKNCQNCIKNPVQTRDQCAICRDGYGLNYTSQDPCQRQNQNQTHCMTLDTKNGKCFICDEGYYINQGICFKRQQQQQQQKKQEEEEDSSLWGYIKSWF